MSRSSRPISRQSRRASSTRRADWLIQSARFVPRSQRSRTMAAAWRPLPQPVPSPSIQPCRNRTGSESGASISMVESRALPSSSRANVRVNSASMR